MEKAKIQYVGQFYIHGSAAKKLDIRKQLRLPKTTLPLFRPNRSPVRYFEPVAVISIVLALALVCTMAFGMLQIRQDWAEYQEMRTHLTQLQSKNAELHRKYRDAYDMEALYSKALGLGLVPVDEVEHMTIILTPVSREEVPEMTWVQEAMLFWTNLWS